MALSAIVSTGLSVAVWMFPFGGGQPAGAATGRPTLGQLSGVACTSATSCMAVGSQAISDTSSGTLAEQWNGSSWSIVPTPSPSITGNVGLAGISCVSASWCVAVGSFVGSTSSGALVDQWDGSVWSTIDVPDAAGLILGSVSCTSTSACMAVGFNIGSGHRSLVTEHFDGSAWTAIPAARLPDASQSSLNSVACTGASNCLAVGTWSSTTAGPSSLRALGEQWRGTTWRVVPTATRPGHTTSLDGVACAGGSSCLAVGESIAPGGATMANPFSVKWNGARWVRVAHSARRQGSTGALDCSGRPTGSTAPRCEAVGFIARPPSSAQAIAESWDGRHWSRVPVVIDGAAKATRLTGISCSGPRFCMAVGSTGLVTGQPLAVEWSGTTWTSVPTPAL